MAIKIKKRSQRDEENGENAPEEEIAAVETADRVIEASRDSWSWLSENRNLAIAAVVVLVAGILAFTLVRQAAERRLEATSSAVYEAYKVVTVPIGAEDAPAEDPQFATLNEQLQELRNRAVQVAAQNEGDAVALAQLLASSSRLALGDDDSAALAGFRAYREQAQTGLDRIVADVGIATALASNGDLEQALSVLDELVARYDYAATTIAPLRASLVDTFGEPAAAVAAYEEAIAALDGAPGAGRLEGRLLELQIRAGLVEATPAADVDASGEEPVNEDSEPAPEVEANP